MYVYCLIILSDCVIKLSLVFYLSAIVGSFSDTSGDHDFFKRRCCKQPVRMLVYLFKTPYYNTMQCEYLK
jgi:hypothetical protein